MSPDTPESELHDLLDERRIKGVLLAYCQGVDRRNWDQVRSCYHDAAVDSHGAFAGSPDELIEWLRARHQTVTSSMHILTNVSVQLPQRSGSAPRLAHAESYCISLQVVQPNGSDPFAGDGTDRVFTSVGCRYIDVLEHREDTGWRIRKRDVVFEWMRRQDADDFAELDPSWTQAARDRTDLLYAPLPPA